MRVWVAIYGYDYEGYCEPIGVFTTEELAQEALKKKGFGDNRDVFEYEIDVPNFDV